VTAKSDKNLLGGELIHRLGDLGPTPPGGATPLGFAVIGLCLITFAMGQSVLLTVLGPLGREIGLSEFNVGKIVAATALTIMLLSPWWGLRSDRWGRRTVMVFGLMAFSITMAIFAFTVWLGLKAIFLPMTVFWLMIGARLLYAVTTAGIQPAATAFIADKTSGHRRATGLALVSASLGVGTAIGPPIGGFLILQGFLAPLIAVAVLAFATGLAVLFILKEPAVLNPTLERKRLRFWDKGLLPSLTLMFLVLSVGSATQQTAPFYVQDVLGMNTKEVVLRTGIALGASALALIVAQILMVHVLHLRPSWLIRGGFVVAFAGFGVLLIGGTYAVLITGYAVIGFGTGMLIPGLMAGASLGVPEDNQGAMAGLMGSAMSAGFVAGPLLGTWTYQNLDKTAPLWGAMGAIILALIISFSVKFVRPIRHKPGAGAE